MFSWFINLIFFLVMLISIILLCILFIPITYRVYGKRKTDNLLWLNVVWLFGLIQLKIKLYNGWLPDIYGQFGHRVIDLNDEYGAGNIDEQGLDNDKEEDAHSKKRSNKKKKTKKKMSIKDILDKQIITLIKAFIKDVLKFLQPDRIEIRGSIGLEDPYSNGIISGFLYTARTSGRFSHCQIDVLYDRVGIEGDILVVGRLQICVLCGIVLKYLVKQPVRKLLLKQIRR